MRAVYLSAALAIAVASPALAKDIVVQMKNQGSTPGQLMVFEPAFIKAAVGDTVKFLPTNPGHNAGTIPGLLPVGVPVQNGQINKEFDLKVTKPGIYGIKCTPHYSLGMVAIVQVGPGPSPNLAAARAVKLPGLAGRRATPLLAMAR